MLRIVIKGITFNISLVFNAVYENYQCFIKLTVILEDYKSYAKGFVYLSYFGRSKHA